MDICIDNLEGLQSDAPPADGPYLSCELRWDAHRLEFRTSERLLPTLYLDDRQVSPQECQALTAALGRQKVLIVEPPKANRLDALDARRRELVLSYFATNPNIVDSLRLMARKACKKYGIRWKPWASRFDTLEKLVVGGGLVPTVDGHLPNEFTKSGVNYRDANKGVSNEFLQAAPRWRQCHRCGVRKSKSEFSIKVSRHPNGDLKVTRFSSYCRSCKRALNRLSKLPD